MFLKKKSLLIWGLIITTLLSWCNSWKNINPWNCVPSEGNTCQPTIKKAIQVKNVNINKKIIPTKQNVESYNNSSKWTIQYIYFTAKKCWIICSNIHINKLFKWIKIKEETLSTPVKWIQNAFPLLYTNNLEGVAKLVSILTKRNVTPNQLNNKVLNTLGIEKTKDWYYVHLWVFAIWKENYCNNGIDDDWDGKIDLADKKDCKQVVVYYDSKASWVYNKKAIEEYMNTTMPIWFHLKFIDYNKNKNIYYDMLKTTKRAIYLPLFLVQDIPDYYPVYINTLKKQLAKIDYTLKTKKGKIVFKYARVLGQGWDPISKKIVIRTFKTIWKLTSKELEYYNKKSMIINTTNNKIWLIVWSAWLCPFCKKLMNNLFNQWIINNFNSIDIEEFPLPSLHWKTDNDIAVFNTCIDKTIINGKEKLKLIREEYDNPSIKIDHYFSFLINKKDKILVKKCYDTDYNKILLNIKKKDSSDADRFKINGTPFIILYNKETWVYWTIPWYVSSNIMKQAIKNLEEKK